LKEMYLNLLATASDDRCADQAHPAFAEVIKQLAPEEAKLLSSLFALKMAPVAEVSCLSNNLPGSYFVLVPYLIHYTEDDEKTPAEAPHQLATWIDNWQRLKLIDVSFTKRIAAEQAYGWVQDRPEYIRLQQEYSIAELRIAKGIIKHTAFGAQFIRAVTLCINVHDMRVSWPVGRVSCAYAPDHGKRTVLCF
jgi:hypothetical protein